MNPPSFISVDERRPKRLPDGFSKEDAIALKRLGERFANQSDSDKERSLLTVSRLIEGEGYELAVKDCVGFISLKMANSSRLEINVEPKVGTEAGDHVWRLLVRGLPLGTNLRVLPEDISAGEAPPDLLEVIAYSYCHAAEKLLESDLSRDYVEVEDELSYARGKVQMLATSRNLLRGRMRLSVRFEESSVDTPLNRAVLAAAWGLASNPRLNRKEFDGLRSRVRRIIKRMGGVGELLPGDLGKVSLDRRTGRYRETFDLAKLLLANSAVASSPGGVSASSFLIKTPLLVEKAIRRALKSGLSPEWVVRKGTFPLAPASAKQHVNPDLYFESGGFRAVGDVKYQIPEPENYWTESRTNVYEVVSFAAAVGASHACLVDFSAGPCHLEDLVFTGSLLGERAPREVGTPRRDISVRRLYWDLSLTPEQAEQGLVDQARLWLREASSERAPASASGAA